jgi:hypothetical protein
VLQINKTVHATVEHVANFGMYARFENHSLLVHLPEMSWVAPYVPSRHFHPGDRVRLKVLGGGARGQQPLASLRQVYPAENPWGSVEVGTIVEGMVHIADAEMVTVKLSDHVFADFLRDRITIPIVVGSPLKMIVAAIESLPLVVVSVQSTPSAAGYDPPAGLAPRYVVAEHQSRSR